MFVQNDLVKRDGFFSYFSNHFQSLTICTAVVVTPFVLFAIGGRGSNTPAHFSIAWLIMAIAVLFAVSTGMGLSMFRHEEMALSISTQNPRASAVLVGGIQRIDD